MQQRVLRPLRFAGPDPGPGRPAVPDEVLAAGTLVDLLDDDDLTDVELADLMRYRRACARAGRGEELVAVRWLGRLRWLVLGVDLGSIRSIVRR